jgi:hypothetical protein
MQRNFDYYGGVRASAVRRIAGITEEQVPNNETIIGRYPNKDGTMNESLAIRVDPRRVVDNATALRSACSSATGLGGFDDGSAMKYNPTKIKKRITDTAAYTTSLVASGTLKKPADWLESVVDGAWDPRVKQDLVSKMGDCLVSRGGIMYINQVNGSGSGLKTKSWKGVLDNFPPFWKRKLGKWIRTYRAAAKLAGRTKQFSGKNLSKALKVFSLSEAKREMWNAAKAVDRMAKLRNSVNEKREAGRRALTKSLARGIAKIYAKDPKEYIDNVWEDPNAAYIRQATDIRQNGGRIEEFPGRVAARLQATQPLAPLLSIEEERAPAQQEEQLLG